jgi:SAM-dependent methyltransferase
MKHGEVILDLGEHLVSGFTNTLQEAFEGNKYPLKLIYDAKLHCPVLTEQPPFEMMWGEYWYQSGINGKMVNDLRDVVNSVENIVKPIEKKVWLDIASNDGTLLKMVDDKFYKVGCDPVQGVIAQLGEANSSKFINDYFSSEKYFENVTKKANVITCCAMFYDLQDPLNFLKDVKDCLTQDGIFVFQYTYTETMYKMGDFMNICHEHFAYHSFINVNILLMNAGLHVFDVELNDVNGGSVRIYCSKNEKNKNISFARQTLGNINICGLSEYELSQGKLNMSEFIQMIPINRMIFTDYIKNAKREGKSVWGYGASTKANTLLQYYGLDYEDIEKVAEANSDKFGKFMKGSGIEICSEEEWRKASPELTIAFPFQFIDYFVERENKYLQDGGTFLVPCPKPHLITKDGISML